MGNQTSTNSSFSGKICSTDMSESKFGKDGGNVGGSEKESAGNTYGWKVSRDSCCLPGWCDM